MLKTATSHLKDSAQDARSEIYRAIKGKRKWEAEAAFGMSSRPLVWSKTGADKMSRLRIYRQNKGNMPELVRYQKQELPLAAGTEEVIYSATQMLSAESRNRAKLGELADVPVYSIPYSHIKKIAALKNHIWGL